MLKGKSSYTETADITCLETGKTLTGEILEFKPAYLLVVSVDRKVKVTLRYNTDKKLYLGIVGSLEFTSPGPKETVSLQGRRR